MEEKKKRFRPTLTAYRELESENKMLRDRCDCLMADCNKQRLANNVLKAKVSSLDKVADELRDKIEYMKGRGFLARLFNW